MVQEKISYATRHSQAACAVESAMTLLHLTGLFDECEMGKSQYGSDQDGNRVRVWTVTLVISEAARLGEEGGA